MSIPFSVYFKEHVASQGGLLLASRMPVEVMEALEKMFKGRKLTWLCEEDVVLSQASRHFLSRRAPLSFSKQDAPKELGEGLASYIEEGGLVIFVSGEHTAHKGESVYVEGDILNVLCSLNLPIIPLSVSIPKETILETESSRRLPPFVLCFGEPIASDKVDNAAWRVAISQAESYAFSKRDFLQESLPYHLLKGFKKHAKNITLFDGSDDSSTTFDKLFAAAMALSKELIKETNKKRIGILLPPGKGGMVANLAVLFAGKIPVNLNFTASRAAVASAIQQADIDKFITADAFVRKVASFPWPPTRQLIYIERLLPRIKKKIIRWVILSKLLPFKLLVSLLGIDKKGGDKEAVLLFTSGSSGIPKGVALSHANLLANVCQFGSRVYLGNKDRILGCLPLFHSFGGTVTLWYPCLQGINMVTYPSPLETKRLAQLIEQYKVDLLLATPTFLRGYMRRASAKQLASLRFVVAGAEKLSPSLAHAFEERFSLPIFEGYGLTETSPVSHVNLPNPLGENGKPIVPTHLQGSVGRIVPGLGFKLLHPATSKPVACNEIGVLWLKGANVFNGYLGLGKKNAEFFKDGWFNTGDIARIDEEGFLFIEGRLSRFSKIAGEMVPHETLEEAVIEVLALQEDSDRSVAVVSLPDEQKGESIALLTTLVNDALEQECVDLRYKLMKHGIPGLWCPKTLIPTEEIPILASGKLDIRACQEIARRATEKKDA